MKTKIILLICIGILTGCNSDKKETQTLNDAINVENWARPGTQGQMSGAYLTYENPLNVVDTLVSAESSVAAMTQIHESYITDDGLSGMREMKQLIVQPGDKLILKKGGLHVMLMNLNRDLNVTDSVNVTLNFSQAGKVKIKLPVLTNN